MADRMIIMPPRLTARQSGTAPRLDYVFVYPDVLAGAKVRLIVYDLDLFRQNPLCAAEGPGFARFKRGDQARAVLDPANAHPTFGSELDPLLVNGSGILLKLDGTLLRTQKLPAPQGWYFSKRAEAVENSDKPFSIVRLHMPMDEKDADSRQVNADAIARIILRDDSFQHQITDHRLVFRVALTHPHAGIPAGGVVAQSLCPEHNPACPPAPPDNPRNAGAIVLEAAAVKQGKPPRIGGPDDPPAPLSPTPSPRVLPFDLTGFYEHDSPNPEMILQVNQAGYSIVGWFSKPFTIFTPPANGIPNLPTKPGCFYNPNPITNPAPGVSYLIAWQCQPAGSSINQGDPDDYNQTQHGELRRIPQPGAPGGPQDELIELTFEHDDGSPSATARFRKVKRGARWPWHIIADPALLSPDEREAVVVAHVQPVVGAAWERMRAQMNPAWVIEGGGGATFGDLIRSWYEASEVGSGRKLAREEVSKHLYTVISPFKDFYGGDHRRRAAAARMQAFAAQYRLKIGSADETVLTWLRLIIGHYATDLVRKTGDDSAEFIERMLDKGFKDAEIWPGGRFVYTIKFEKLGVPKVPVLKAYVFRATIKKEIRQDDGTLVPDKTWAMKSYDTKKLNGFFIATGVGYGFGGGSEKKVSRGGAFPSEAVFDTLVNLQLPDFNGAWFSIVALELGKADSGQVKGAVLSSSMLQLRLRNGAHLVAIVSEEFKFGFSGGKPGGAKLFELSGGFGKITTDDIPDIDVTEDSSDRILEPKSEDVRAEAQVLFDKDSASLRDRHQLERRLAIVRAIFETEDPAARALGYTSPEGSEAHNDDLSQRRAAAVKTAVLDAFPPEMALTHFDVVGHGEKPGIIRQGFLDPPGVTAEDRIRIHREENDYAKWRKVDVFVSSLLVVRAAPKDEKKGKGP